MKFDGFTISKILNHSRSVKGGRVRKIRITGREFFYFDIENFKDKEILLISLSVSSPYWGILKEGRSLLKNAQGWDNRFVMLLNKYIRNGRILDVNQIDNDRIVRIDFEKFDDGGNRFETALVAELTGRCSNLVLFECSTMKILGAVNYYSPLGQQMRPVIPGVPYTYPKPGGIYFTEENYNKLLEKLEIKDTSMACLYTMLQGFSKESWENILSASNLDKSVSAKECLFEKSNFNKLINCIETFRPDQESLFFNLKKWTENENKKNLENIFSDLKQALKKALKRTCKKKEALKKDLYETKNMDYLKYQADMIMAELHNIHSKSSSIELRDFTTNEMVEILLDPSLSALENAEKLYKKSRKLKKRKQACKREIESLERIIFFLEDQIMFCMDINIDSPEDLVPLFYSAGEFIRASKKNALVFKPLERRLIYSSACQAVKGFKSIFSAESFNIASSGKGNKIKGDKKGFQTRKKKSREVHSKREPELSAMITEYSGFEGIDILIGSGPFQNDFLTFKVAGRDDLWFHAREIPGAHVIARISGKNINRESDLYDQLIERCAGLAAFYSKAGKDLKVTVQYAFRKYIRKTNDLPPGMVLVTKEDTIRVKPFGPEADKIKKARYEV
jgi:predicted ribosome quality control (RQC) complex YloA/Tae2 family protein